MTRFDYSEKTNVLDPMSVWSYRYNIWHFFDILWLMTYDKRYGPCHNCNFDWLIIIKDICISSILCYLWSLIDIMISIIRYWNTQKLIDKYYCLISWYNWTRSTPFPRDLHSWSKGGLTLDSKLMFNIEGAIQLL